MFGFFTKKNADIQCAAQIYSAAVMQARQPFFYEDYGVPDTVDGRFEMICLHVFLVMERMTKESPAGARLSQALFDVMFRDMDQSLREQGVGDLSLPKHVKRMMKGFNGRALAYKQALYSEGDSLLQDALRRNVFGTVDNVNDTVLDAMAAYVRESFAVLEGQAYASFAAGNFVFESSTYGSGLTNDNKYAGDGMVA